jgi:hypothetical protein
MTNDERLVLRARQLLDDDTLPPQARLENAGALLRQLALDVRDRPLLFDAVLAEITDASVQARMRDALETLLRELS